MLRLGAVVLSALVLLAPSASAQSLEEQYQDLHFERLVFTIGWNTDSNKAEVVVTAEDLRITGQGASDLRRCMDGDDCPVPELEGAARGSTTDGELSGEEVESFAELLRSGLYLNRDVTEIRNNVRGLIKIDDLAAGSASLSGLFIDGAEGSVGSTEAIDITVRITAVYALVKDASTHEVWMQRAESNLTIADEIIVQPGRNWRIMEDTIAPPPVASLFDDGRLSGTQEQFESSEPLTFTIEYHRSAAGGWVLWLSITTIVAAATAGGVYIWRRKL